MSTDTISLNVEARTTSGTGAARRLRRAGKVPGVLYGRDENISIALEALGLGKTLGHAHIVEVKFSDGHGTVNALVKDIQWDHIAHTILHVDLQSVRMDETLKVLIDIEAIGQVVTGGTLEQRAYQVEVECLPAKVPQVIRVDISGLALDDILKAGQIPMPEGVVAVDAGAPLFAVVVQTAAGVEDEVESTTPAAAGQE